MALLLATAQKSVARMVSFMFTWGLEVEGWGKRLVSVEEEREDWWMRELGTNHPRSLVSVLEMVGN